MLLLSTIATAVASTILSLGFFMTVGLIGSGTLSSVQKESALLDYPWFALMTCGWTMAMQAIMVYGLAVWDRRRLATVDRKVALGFGAVFLVAFGIAAAVLVMQIAKLDDNLKPLDGRELCSLGSMLLGCCVTATSFAFTLIMYEAPSDVTCVSV